MLDLKTIIVIVLVLAIVLIAVSGLIWVLNGNKRIPVIGFDISAGSVDVRKLRLNRHGGLTWRKPGKAFCHLVLDDQFAYRGRRGPVYAADVSASKGVVMRLQQDQTVLTMPGERLWVGLFNGGLRDIGESAKTNYENVIMIGLVIAGVLLISIVGILFYIINKMQSSGAI